MPDNKEPQKRFTWNIHYDCNYRCPYCFFEGKWVEYKKRNVYLSTQEWLGYWKKIYDKYGRCYLLLTGGEPFIYPDFINLIEELSYIHYPINISTNASGDLKSFAQRIDPQKVSLSLSLQLNFEKLDSFLEKVRFLQGSGFQGNVNFVAYPPFVKQINFFTEQFNSIGAKFKVIPFWGKYNNEEYPFSYTKEEKEVIGISDSWFSNVRKKDWLCPAGYNSALIFPDGKISRCGQIGEKTLLGNFFDPQFKLLEAPLACEAEFCPCDESKLFGEAQEKAESRVKNDKKIEIRVDEKNNLSFNEAQRLKERIVLSSSPKTIFIQAAGPCNSSCTFCSRGKEYEVFDLAKHRQKFEEKLYPFISKADELILTGSGEYLQLPEAGDILGFFDDNFPQVRKVFSTNGSSLAGGIADKIMNGKSNYTIHVSLHASNSKLHKVMTRMENFDQIINQLTYIISKRKQNDKPRINLIFVATTLNIEDLPEFVRMAANLGADKVICYYNFIYIPAQKYLSCFFKQELTNNLLDEAKSVAEKLNMPLDLPYKFGQKEYPYLGVCREPFSQIMFDVNGRVLPCDASEDCHEVLDKDEDFMGIWNGDYYQRLRQSLINGTCSCFKHCLRANPASVNDFKSHVIHRGQKEGKDVDILWGDNF